MLSICPFCEAFTDHFASIAENSGQISGFMASYKNKYKQYTPQIFDDNNN